MRFISTIFLSISQKRLLNHFSLIDHWPQDRCQALLGRGTTRVLSIRISYNLRFSINVRVLFNFPDDNATHRAGTPNMGLSRDQLPTGNGAFFRWYKGILVRGIGATGNNCSRLFRCQQQSETRICFNYFFFLRNFHHQMCFDQYDA